MAKKHQVLCDELNIKGTGIYAIFPWERLDKHKSGVFKIGLSDDLVRRIDTYHGYFPMGSYLVAFLEKPTLQKVRGQPIRTYLEKIESFVFESMINRGALPIYSTARIEKFGFTEWIYASMEMLEDAFVEAQGEYGGKLSINHLKDINQIANENQQKPNYHAEIYIPLNTTPNQNREPVKKRRSKR